MKSKSDEYIEALNRLIQRNEEISINAVAREAGNATGSLRKERFPEVIAAINEAKVRNEYKVKPVAKKVKKTSSRDRLALMKSDLGIALQKVVSLEMQLFEAYEEIRTLKEWQNNVTALKK